MKNTFRKLMAWILVICAMQCCFVPTVSAASNSVTYDFYTRYSNYNYLYHWRTVDNDDYFDTATELASGTKVAKDQIASDYNNNLVNWKIERGGGYASPATGKTSFISSTGWATLYMGSNSDVVIRLKSPGKANYKVVLNYVTRENQSANIAAKAMIIPAKQDSYTSAELSALISQYRYSDPFSCYGEDFSWRADCKSNSMTLAESYPFLDDQDYFLVIGGGSLGGQVYLQSLKLSYAGEYTAPEETEYPRPVTILEEALTRWEEGFHIVTEVNGEDYLAIPIYGGKMYIFNLDTWQLVDVVNTGVDTPRGTTVDDDGVIYLVGTSYSIFTYDLKTNRPGKTEQFTGNGVAMGSAYDIHYSNGNLYFGTDKGHVIRYDLNTSTFTAVFLNDLLKDSGIQKVGYVSSVIGQDGYIYAAATNSEKKHYLVKLTDTETPALAGIVEYTSTGPSTYMGNMSITKEGLILGAATQPMVVDTNTMTLLSAEEYGSNVHIAGYVSEEIDGKYYYVGSYTEDGTEKRRLYCYDPAATDGNKVTSVPSLWPVLDCQGKTVTFDRDDDGKDEKYLVAVEGAKKYGAFFVNPLTGEYFNAMLPIDENAGASTGVNSLTNGPTGSNELYYGGFTSNELHIYNIAEGKITDKIKTSGIQIDAIYVDGDTIYAGNYTEAQLTKVNRTTGKADVLMTLHNSLFNQSRIHGITGGDGKIFFGTFPYVYAYGGVLAWYETDTGYSYVAVGPDSADVYYSENASAKTPVWKDLQGNVVTSISGTTAGQDVDGVDGVVLNQGIKDVVYRNGILYAATSTSGGTNTSPVDGTSAVVIAYSVEEKKVIATFDPKTQGFAGPVPTISGIELDENGTLWCVASETLFTLTLDANNKFVYNEKLSFDKLGYDGTQNRVNSDIRFMDGYVYVAFEGNGGLCKVNMANPSDYTLLMPNVTSYTQVPNSFALGEDGNLYFLLGSSLKMLPLNDTDDEWAAADAVTAQIAAITEQSTSEEIAVVRKAYEALTLREKSLVQNLDVLVQAEADALMKDIAALGEVTWEKKARVEALLTSYRAMPMSQQNKVANYYVLATANKQLLQMEADAPVVANGAYYMTLEDALASAAGTIQLRADFVAGAVDLGNKVLDLNGYILTATSITGNVMDSADGKGLIKTGQENAVLTAADNQLILWDNAMNASGYRLFDYTFTNEGVDRNENKNDAASSKDMDTKVKSFWSDLTFTNPYAYTLVGSTYTGLEIGFKVSWTPDSGETTSKTFVLDAATIQSWSEAETEKTDENYCFYIQLTGFNDLLTDGVVTVKPYAKTAFQTLTEVDDTIYNHKYMDPDTTGLTYELGFGIVFAK